MFTAIGNATRDRFALRRDPDGVYRVDGRVIPVCDDAALGVDNGQPIVGIHHAQDMGVSLLGAELAVHVEQGELKLPVRS